MKTDPGPLSVVVVGGSGDLARKKIYPALFALYCRDLLPADFRVFGFARSAFSDAAFRGRVEEHLTCRYAPGASCAERMQSFLSHCFYRQGDYGDADAFLDLYEHMRAQESDADANRMFFLAIPPSIFLAAAGAIGDAGLIRCGPARPWSRVVIEKPFGRDRESSDALAAGLGNTFTEEQTYRIDHYLGKEVIQNLMVLRFANRVFEPLWNRMHVESVHIDWREEIGVEGRGGYFDGYGIIRDVVQNHLLQVLALTAMERPVSASAEHVRNEKVRVLRAIPPLGPEDVVVGQYAGYRGEEGVPDDSRTPTYAAVALHVGNDRWDRVPFAITAGKALDGRCNRVRIRFRRPPENIFAGLVGDLPANELVIRVQPDEGIDLRVVNKQPGMDMTLVPEALDLQYQAAFETEIPDAYERLLLDVIAGDKSLFIRSDELAASWDVFTPVLRRMEEAGADPERYERGTGGPDAARILLASRGMAL